MIVTHSMTLRPTTSTTKEELSGGVYNHKPAISYLNQAIVLVHQMSGFENINTVDDVIKYIFDNKSVNVPLLPDYSGVRVNEYYAIVKICYGLIQQRQFLSRSSTVFKFLNSEQVQSTYSLVGILHHNPTVNGMYNKTRRIQMQHIKQWFVNKVNVSFLPNPKEDETANLGCAVVFMEILENAGV